MREMRRNTFDVGRFWRFHLVAVRRLRSHPGVPGRQHVLSACRIDSAGRSPTGWRCRRARPGPRWRAGSGSRHTADCPRSDGGASTAVGISILHRTEWMRRVWLCRCPIRSRDRHRCRRFDARAGCPRVSRGVLFDRLPRRTARPCEARGRDRVAEYSQPRFQFLEVMRG